MTLKVRLAVAVAAIGAVLGVTAVVLVLLGQRLDAELVDVEETWQPAARTTRTLLAAMVDQETGSRGFVITADPTFLEPYAAGRARAAAALEQLDELLRDDPAAQALLTAITADVAVWERLGPEREIPAASAGDAARARRLVANGGSRDAFAEVRQSIAALETELDGALAAGNARLANLLRIQAAARALTLSSLLALIGLTAWAIRAWVLRPVDAIRAAMRRVAAGDLTARVPAVGPPEIAALAADADAMRARLVDELRNVRVANQALDQRGPVVSRLREELVTRDPAAAGMRMAAELLPAEGLVAGDFSSVTTLPDGRVALLVGDVSGHGAEAGLAAAWVRSSVAVGLRLGVGLPELLDAVAGLFAGRPLTEERLASCVIVVVEPCTGRLTWVNAGHPPPLVMTLAEPDHDVVVARLRPTGPVLSALGGQWRLGEAWLEPDDVLLLVTDGLQEARDAEGREFGEAGMIGAVAAADSTDPEAVVAAFLAALRDLATGPPRDDVAILAAALAVDSVPSLIADGAADPETVVHLSPVLPATAAAPGLARVFVAASLPAAMADEARETAVLLTSELVANAVQHADSRSVVTVSRERGLVRVEVWDRAADSRARRREPDGVGGNGLLLVDALADAWGDEPDVVGKAVWFELRTGRASG